MSDDDQDCDDLDRPCPACGAYSVSSRCCDEWDCDDGWIDKHEDDPINFSRGEEYSMCEECCGTGNVVWCRKCGCDITRREYREKQDD